MGIYTELSIRLKEKGIPPWHFAINVVGEDGQYCIQDSGDLIEVFMSERGMKFELKTFTDSEEAIVYFEHWITQRDWGHS